MSGTLFKMYAHMSLVSAPPKNTNLHFWVLIIFNKSKIKLFLKPNTLGLLGLKGTFLNMFFLWKSNVLKFFVGMEYLAKGAPTHDLNDICLGAKMQISFLSISTTAGDFWDSP